MVFHDTLGAYNERTGYDGLRNIHWDYRRSDVMAGLGLCLSSVAEFCTSPSIAVAGY